MGYLLKKVNKRGLYKRSSTCIKGLRARDIGIVLIYTTNSK